MKKYELEMKLEELVKILDNCEKIKKVSKISEVDDFVDGIIGKTYEDIEKLEKLHSIKYIAGYGNFFEIWEETFNSYKKAVDWLNGKIGHLTDYELKKLHNLYIAIAEYDKSCENWYPSWTLSDWIEKYNN